MKFEQQILKSQQDQLNHVNSMIDWSLDDLILKARSGVYSNTPENRKLGRVGQKYGTKKEVEEKGGKDNKDVMVFNKDSEIVIEDGYYLRFQDNKNNQTSVHPYPTKDIVKLYKNEDLVKEAIKRVDNGEIEWDNLLNYYDEEDFRFREGYVAAVNFDNEEKVKVSGQKFRTTPSASDKYVVIFEGDYENEHEIFDGLVTKMKNVKAIYEKSNNGYVLVEKDGKKVQIN